MRRHIYMSGPRIKYRITKYRITNIVYIYILYEAQLYIVRYTYIHINII